MNSLGAIGSWSLIVAVKDEAVLNSTLLRSPDIDHRCQIILKRGYSSAGRAYNEGAAEASNELLVFAHTDVYLPAGWLGAVERSLNSLARRDPAWGVLGVCGRTSSGSIAGHVYSTGSGRTFGNHFDEAVPTRSLDELVLMTRQSASLQFDENLPGFHLYGTDICYEARRRGMKSYIIPAFCIHNSNGIRSLPAEFWRAYFYLRRKWWQDLPIRSCCTDITRSSGPFLASFLTRLRQAVAPSNVGSRCADPEMLYRALIQAGKIDRLPPGSTATTNPWKKTEAIG